MEKEATDSIDTSGPERHATLVALEVEHRREIAILLEQLAAYQSLVAELQAALRSRDDPAGEADELERLKKRLANAVVTKTENARQHHDAIAKLKQDMRKARERHAQELATRGDHSKNECACCCDDELPCDTVVARCGAFIMTLLAECSRDKLPSDEMRRKCDRLANTLDAWNSKRPALVVPRSLLKLLYDIAGEWENGKPVPYQNQNNVLVINHASTTPANSEPVLISTVDNQC